MEKPNLHLKVKLTILFSAFAAILFSQQIAPFSNLPDATSCDTVRDRIVYLWWDGAKFVNKKIAPGVILRKSPGSISGSGTANKIAKWSSSTALTNSQIYDNGTNVGIGTTSPAYSLDVNGTLNTRFIAYSKFGFVAGVPSSQTGELNLYNSANNYVVTFRPGVTTPGDITYTLPVSLPGASGYALTCTTGGVMSWSNVPTGSGTTNFIPLWSSSSGLTNSYLSQSGLNIKLPSSRFITAHDTAGCQIDLNYGGERKSFNISTDRGQDSEAWMYGDSASLQLGYASNTGVTLTNTTASLSNNQGAHATTTDSAHIVHTAIVSLKAPSVRVNGTFRINSGSPSSGKVWTATNTSGDGTWSTIGGTISGLTSGTIPIATSSTTLGNSSLSQVSGDVLIASGKKFYDATGVNSIDLMDGVSGITIDANGNDISFVGSTETNGVATCNESKAHTGMETGTSNTSNGYLTFYNSGNTNTLRLRSGSTATTIEYVLPSTAPTAGQVLSSTAPSAGVATTSWVSAASGTVTSIATGNGITGGTITSTGTLGLSGATGDIGSFSGTNTYSAISAAASGKILQAQGLATKPAYTPFTLPTSVGTSGKLLISDGTNYVNSTPTFPNSSATSGKMIVSDGTNWVASTPTYPNAAPTAGTYLRGDGTNFITSTLTLPNSATANNIFYATGTNAMGSSTDLTYNGSWVQINRGSTGAFFVGSVAGADKLYISTNSAGGVITTPNTTQALLFCTNNQTTDVFRITPNTNRTFFGGSSTATAIIHLAAGTATASTAPLKFTSGTNLTTAETGAVEYNGTNLFFTRTGTTRESIMTANSVNSVSPTSPNRTITVVIDGTTYYIAAKTTND